MSNYIWHPFTQMYLAPEPVFIESGEGALLKGRDGKTYIDAISSWWTNIHGHAHPYIAEKIFDQAKTLEHVIFAGFMHAPAETLASRLVENYLPKHITKVFFSDNGSTAVEVGIKMAIQYWKNTGQPKKKIIAFENAYHGDTFGSMSVSDRGAFTAPFHDYLFDVEFIPLPSSDVNTLQLFKNIAENGDVAAFIYEPMILGAGGMLMYAPEALDSLLEIAKAHHIICIADEVMTGFYRTGKLFAGDLCVQQPDIICMSKGLTGGTMALGLTGAAQFIFDAFYAADKMKAFYHGHSFTANPLACTAANASLDLVERSEFLPQVNRIIQRHSEFAHQLSQYPAALNIRQRGTIIAFDVDTGAETQYFNSLRDRLYEYFMEHGVLLRPLGNTVYIMPPYCTTDAQLNTIYGVIISFLEQHPPQ